LSLLTTGATVVLFYRLSGATVDLKRSFQHLPAGGELVAALHQVIDQAVDRSLLVGAGQGGWADIELRFREHQDPYRTTAELLEHIARSCQTTKFNEVIHLIKMIYQLQYTLEISAGELESCFNGLIARLRATSSGGKSIGRIDFVTPGMLLDTHTMMYLSNGTHVLQPLGFVIYDLEKKVVSKAKVLCS
jgi:hypothetical protein